MANILLLLIGLPILSWFGKLITTNKNLRIFELFVPSIQLISIFHSVLHTFLMDGWQRFCHPIGLPILFMTLNLMIDISIIEIKPIYKYKSYTWVGFIVTFRNYIIEPLV